MRILQLCQKPPFPPVDGGCLASLRLSQHLMELGIELKILTLSTPKHPFQTEKISESFLSESRMEHVHIDNSLNPFNILHGIGSKNGIQKSRFYRKDFSHRIQEILHEKAYDAVIFDGLMTCYYLEDVKRFSGNIHTVYRSHNLEYNVYLDKSIQETNWFKSHYLSLQSKKIQNFEKHIWQSVDQVWSISMFDSVVIKKESGKASSVHYFPFSMKNLDEKKGSKEGSVFHLASMDWAPNLEGINHFLEKVWPKVSDACPEAELHLGGRGMDAQKLAESNQTVIHTKVEDAQKFYSNYEIMIVPVLRGNGIRIKIIEALAMGKVIVSTKKGAMGIPAIHGEHMMVCEDSGDMVEILTRLLKDAKLRENISNGARKLYMEHFEFNKVSKDLNTLLENLN